MRTNLNSLIIERLRAELRTIPRARITLKQQVNAPRASVLVPLCLDCGVPSVLFTKRPSTMSNHPGQVAFPGGKIDDTDQNEADAALRELFEEVGIQREYVDVLGMLPDAVARSKRETVVTPVIGFLKSDLTELDLKLNPGEVESSFTLPLDWLLDAANRDEFKTMPRFRHPTDADKHVWGFSGFVLDRLLAATRHLLLSEIPSAAVQSPSVERSESAHQKLNDTARRTPV